MGFGKLGNSVTYSADEGRDKGNTSLGTSNGLAETEEEGKVTAVRLLAMFSSKPNGQNATHWMPSDSSCLAARIPS